MREITAVVLITVLAIGGCTGYPRYSSGKVELPAEARDRRVDFSTRDYIRLGLIIQGYLGRPYSGASRYDPGLDCSLFTQEVFKDYNQTQLPRTSEKQFQEGRPIPRQQLRYGDLVFFNTTGYGISHVGIYVGYNEFAHASTSQGVIISSLREEYWGKRYVGARRILK